MNIPDGFRKLEEPWVIEPGVPIGLIWTEPNRLRRIARALVSFVKHRDRPALYQLADALGEPFLRRPAS